MESKNSQLNNWYQNLTSEFIRYSVFFFGASVFISNLLWFGFDTTLPKVPLFGEATYDESYYFLDNIFCIASIGLVIFSVWTRGKGFNLAWAIVLFFISLFLDLKRCNALFYFYICFWTLYWFSLKTKSDIKPSLILFISALYIWSGIHKIHPFFFDNNFVWMMKSFDITAPLASYKWLSHAISALEIGFGVLLLFNRTRKLGVFSLVLMHIYIIAAMIKTEWNTMVIPWNAFMILCLIAIFYFQVDLRKAWSLFDRRLKGFLILTSFILPSLFFFYAINPAFAYTMYSGRTIYGDIVFRGADVPKIQSPYKDKIEEYDDFFIIDINHLGPDIQNAPINYSEFVFKKIFHKFTENFTDSTYLMITKFPILKDSVEYEYTLKEGVFISK